MSLKRVITLVLLVVVVLPVIGLTVFISQFNLNSYAPQIIAAVDQVTGRQLTLGSPIRLALSFTPTVQVDNVSLGNPPGFAGPNLLTLKQLQARIALLPLLSHQVDILKLVLVGPNITLERNAASEANWDLTPYPGPPQSTAPANGNQAVYTVALESVEIKNGLLTVKNANTQSATTLALTELTGTADSAASPLKLDVRAVYDGAPLTLTGIVGPVQRFSGVGNGPWPVDLALTLNGASATIQGSIAEPRQAKGYDLNVKVNIPALQTFAAGLPKNLTNGAQLPPINGITAAAELVDQNSTLPEINNFSLKAGASDLSTLRPGLALTSADLEMASLNQPFSANVIGSISATPLALTAKFGPIEVLANPAWLPAANQTAPGNFHITANAEAGDAKLSITGALATPAKIAGVALAINATVPDLSKLNGIYGATLPAWKNITFQTTLIDPGGSGLMTAAGFDSIILTMDNASLGGDASLYFETPPRLQLAVAAQQINLDGLIASLPAPEPAPAPAGTPAPQSNTPAQPAPTLIPDTKLPVNSLKKFNADIQFSANSLIFNNATYSAIQGHAVLGNGVLNINPLNAQLPGGDASATATLDATKEPAAATLSYNAPALALGPFLKALKLPDTAQGTTQVVLTMSGTGDSTHAIAATANGQFGLAMVNGVVDGSVLNGIFGTALRSVGLPESLVGAQGPVAVRCFGLRIDATNGVGTIRTLTLDSSRLAVQGGGSLNFGNETLAVILRPQVRLVGNQVGVPVEIGGTFSNPVTSVATLGAIAEATKTAVGLPVSVVQSVTGTNTVVNGVLNTFGLGESDACPAALSLARLGKPGPAPAAPVASPGAAQKLISAPKNLLNSLFGN